MARPCHRVGRTCLADARLGPERKSRQRPGGFPPRS